MNTSTITLPLETETARRYAQAPAELQKSSNCCLACGCASWWYRRGLSRTFNGCDQPKGTGAWPDP